MRYREGKANNGKKKKIFMFRKAERRNFKMDESSRMTIKKYRQCGNIVGEKSVWSKTVLNVC